MSAAEHAYAVAIRLADLTLPLVAWGDGKLARGVRGRKGALQRLASWSASGRKQTRPLAWFHAPSVGEGLQARAVIEELRRLRPDVQIAYTFFSPSAEGFAQTVPADIADYLPLETISTTRKLFDVLRPTVVAFSKTEVWPILTREAEARRVPTALLSATLPASSSRLTPAARAVLKPAHRRLSVVAAIAPEDAARFQMLGVPQDRTVVMGDARFDQVWGRAIGVPAAAMLLETLKDPWHLTIVGGSTWADDEEKLIHAFARLPVEGIRLILVPHEPTDAHLRPLMARLQRESLSAARLSDADFARSSVRVVVVDRVGVLGDLYRLADVAYVGGAFGRRGLHSVLEPAAFGVPVIFGPHYQNSREAADLIGLGAAVSVGTERHLHGALDRWLSGEEARKDAGTRARHYVEANLGAARKGAELVAELLGEA